jgi:hypothetical protein
MTVDRLEQLRRLGDALGGAEKQHALRTKRVVERPQDPTLSHIVQVDEEIATADKVQSREWRIVCHILPRKETDIANLLGNAVIVVLPDEESVEAFSRDFVQGIRVVHAGARLLQRRFADIGPKDLDPGRRLATVEVFEKSNREGVGLLAGRAAGHPDPDRLPRGPPFTQNRENVLAQRVERLRIPEELGHRIKRSWYSEATSLGSLSINATYSSRLSTRCSVIRRSRRRLTVVRL